MTRIGVVTSGGEVDTSRTVDVQSSHDEKVRAGFVPLDADLERDCDAAVRVWEDTIGWAGRLPEMYAAFYLDCPLGRPLLKLLRHEASGMIVGTIGAGPRRVLWEGREIRAGVVSHLAMMPAHRSVRPGLLLSKALVDAARKQFDLLYGLPSPHGAALAKLSGYDVSGGLIRHVKV